MRPTPTSWWCAIPCRGAIRRDPVLLAEVLSDSSTRRDRVDKHAAYTALESLAAYLILSQQEVLVDVYGRAEDWRRMRCEGREGEIRIAALGLSLPLREAYADVLADWAIEPWRDAALRTG
jgi:Uma2 family endonuclease